MIEHQGKHQKDNPTTNINKQIEAQHCRQDEKHANHPFPQWLYLAIGKIEQQKNEERSAC
jgi:hypothetical protein